MMNVSKLIKSSINNELISLAGWLISINNGLYLVEWDEHSDYLKSPKLLIENKGLIDILMHSGRLLFYGGGPLLFHPAETKCYVLTDPESRERKLYIKELLLKSDSKWITIDLDAPYRKHGDYALSWHDIFKQ